MMLVFLEWYVMVLVFYGLGNGEVLKALCIVKVTNHTKRLTLLIMHGRLDVKTG